MQAPFLLYHLRLHIHFHLHYSATSREQGDNDQTRRSCESASARRRLRRSPAGVVRVTVAQLFGDTVCFFGFPSTTIGIRGFIEGAGGDRWIVVEQSDTGVSFARVFKAL